MIIKIFGSPQSVLDAKTVFPIDIRSIVGKTIKSANLINGYIQLEIDDSVIKENKFRKSGEDNIEKDVLEIKKVINSVQDACNTLERQKSELRTELLEKVLACPEILNQAPWDFNENQLCSNIRDHRLFSEFLQTDYHCHFETDNVFVDFNDDDISIVFKRTDSLSIFLKTCKIKIKTKAVERQIDILKVNIKRQQEELKELEENLKSIKIMNEQNALPSATCNP
jgi:hypothetical protein